VQPLSRPQIQEFLRVYKPAQAEAIWDELKDDDKQIDLYSTPYYLDLLTRQITPDGKYRPMCAFADAVGVAVPDESSLELRLNHVAQCVVHDAIAKRRGADFAPLWLVDEKVMVAARAIGLSSQLVLQRDQAIGELMFERSYRALAASKSIH
jgi:hypothetical protein